MKLYEKLSEIYGSVGYLQKDNQGKQYNYVGSSDVLGAVRGLMADKKVLLEPRILESNVREYSTKSGTTQLLTELKMTMTWINAEDPDEKIEIPWYAQGMDLAGEKGVGKALTYGEKYFMLKYFNIATDESDPDAFQEKVEATKPPKKISSEQVEEARKYIKEISVLVGQTPEQAEDALLKVTKMPNNLHDILENQYENFLIYLKKMKNKYENQTKEQQKGNGQQEPEQESLLEEQTTQPKNYSEVE